MPNSFQSGLNANFSHHLFHAKLTLEEPETNKHYKLKKFLNLISLVLPDLAHFSILFRLHFNLSGKTKAANLNHRLDLNDSSVKLFTEIIQSNGLIASTVVSPGRKTGDRSVILHQSPDQSFGQSFSLE